MTSYHENFFRHTSTRWIYDEQRQLAIRYRQFDVEALKSSVVKCTGTDAVADFRKLDEGTYNKVFNVLLNNGTDDIARIPNPNAGPAHLVTSSEVATMQFLRDRLGLTQVPRVLAWSSRPSETPVGSEYIIMDVADGVPLGEVWHQLTKWQKLRVVQQWVHFESTILQALTGGGYGSIYYRKDFPTHLTRDLYVHNKKDEEFALGPSTITSMWEDHYGFSLGAEHDRGPCTCI